MDIAELRRRTREALDPGNRKTNRSAGKPGKFYEFRNVAEGDAVPELLVYDYIDWLGVDAAEFARELAAIDAPEIVVRINSPGGFVYDGLAIANSLRGHPANIRTVVDGLAASAASYIATAGNEVIMRPGAQVMIHDASGITIGNAADLREYADELDKLSDNIAAQYVLKAGGTVAEWRALMLAETWFNDAEAVAAGLADRVDPGPGLDNVEDDDEPAAEASARFDLRRIAAFNFAGRDQAPAPKLPSTARAEADRKGATMSFQGDIAKKLGLPEDATQEEINEALASALSDDEKDEPTDKKIALPDGMAMIEQETLNALTADAAAGREARNAQLAAERRGAVAQAVRDGKLGPGQQAKWVKRLDADPTEIEVLNALPAVYPVNEIGHALDKPGPDGNAGGNGASVEAGGNYGELSESDKLLYNALFPSPQGAAGAGN